jgi:Fis family transcriptional regulator
MTSKDKLCHTFEEALSAFFKQHQHLPNNLHTLAIHAIEKPLFKLALEKTDNNQTQAAKMLGLNRATLRKKLIEYKLVDT